MLRRAAFVSARPAATFTSQQQLTARRFAANNMQDKLLTGAAAAFLSSTSVIGLFHLIVIPLTGTVALSTIAAATATGALSAFEGGEGSSGTAFGTLAGAFIGALGGYFAKSSNEPWNEKKKKH
eukprot:GILI01027342.1.p1 GENE.GILI01027342.1~~GILI01027342.1.p1  ORF type:complete len:124 (+),score=40.81 GILI01027342.1:59-430(+)